MKEVREFLASILHTLLIILALWFMKRIGLQPEEIGLAVKNFNASFVSELPEKPGMKK